jgi:eukaryotic-like serine/threonine-protein kinase
MKARTPLVPRDRSRLPWSIGPAAAGMLLVVAGLVLALMPAGCRSDKTCPTGPDAAVTDAISGEALLPQCQKDKVQCQAGELNAFGVCLAEGTMAKVSAGEFTMGKTEPAAHSPEHKVTLKEYLIDKTEVSVAQYKACVDCGACGAPLRDGSNTGREPYFGNPAFATYPVIYVSWKDAKAYCEGIGKRLPTEAEWEKAARGTDGRIYPWGSDAPTAKHANFGEMENDTKPVTDYDKGKSPYEVLNLAGNVWEWVADTFASDYYAKSPATDPAGPPSGVIKVARGGGFDSSLDIIKSYVRVGYTEGSAYSYLGFRCAMDQWK